MIADPMSCYSDGTAIASVSARGPTLTRHLLLADLARLPDASGIEAAEQSRAQPDFGATMRPSA